MNTLPNLQRDEISHFGGIKTDVALSLWEYNDFIDCLLDERFTADGLLRMKHLSKHLAMSALVTPIFTFPFAYIATQWMNGIYDLS